MPPKIFLRFFQWYCHPKLVDHIEGDLLEVYGERVRIEGKRKADMKFILDVLFLFRPGIIRSFESNQKLNTVSMYKSYLKIGWRNLLKNQGYSSINIVGLALGMSVAMLIGLWVWDEISFDSYFKNRDRLAQVMLHQSNEGVIHTGGTIQMPLGDALRDQYARDIKALSLTSWNINCILSSGETKLRGNAMWVQPDFPEMFTLNIISGNVKALKDPSSVLMSASLAKSLYGNEDPINKPLRVDNKLDMIVGGVYEDLPSNTTFQTTKLLLPWGHNANWMNSQTDWMNHCGQLFVQLSEGADLSVVSEKIKGVPTPHITKWKEEIMLHPLSKAHLYDQFENGKATGGRIQFVWLLGIIGAFVLLLACINFMNLSTARSEKRAKEVGVRKSIGSLR
ncbi:MAG TPA: ABC transporter permease, partial [Chryseolinea sp.]